MNYSFGPWTTAMDSGSGGQLSTFWKKRMAMLPIVRHSPTIVTRRSRLLLTATATLALVLPTVYLSRTRGGGRGRARKTRRGRQTVPCHAAWGIGRRSDWRWTQSLQGSTLVGAMAHSLPHPTRRYIPRHRAATKKSVARLSCAGYTSPKTSRFTGPPMSALRQAIPAPSTLTAKNCPASR